MLEMVRSDLNNFYKMFIKNVSRYKKNYNDSNNYWVRLTVGRIDRKHRYGGPSIAKWICLCLPSCGPAFESRAWHLFFFNLNNRHSCHIFYWSVKRARVNKKRTVLTHIIMNYQPLIRRFIIKNQPSSTLRRVWLWCRN